MLNFTDTLSVSASTNGSVADMPDGKLTYPPPASSSGTDSASDTATETEDVTPMIDDANTLRVGPGLPFDSLGDAIAASKPGDTILLEAGTYESDYSTIGHPLTIRGVGGLAHLKAVDPIPNGKAILVVNADVTLENIMFTDARVPDQNGAGIRHESGDLVIRNSVFQNNENGILSAPNATASVTIRDSEFIGNGYGDGRSHGIYVNQIASLDVEGSTFRDTNVGHHIKSRAQETTSATPYSTTARATPATRSTCPTVAAPFLRTIPSPRPICPASTPPWSPTERKATCTARTAC